MPKTTTGRAPGPRRTMTAAARAAAKRAERGHHEAGAVTATDEGPPRRAGRPLAGRTVLVEAPKHGWDDPPEPSTESFEEDGPQERSEPVPAGAAGCSPRSWPSCSSSAWSRWPPWDGGTATAA